MFEYVHYNRYLRLQYIHTHTCKYKHIQIQSHTNTITHKYNHTQIQSHTNTIIYKHTNTVTYIYSTLYTSRKYIVTLL